VQADRSRATIDRMMVVCFIILISESQLILMGTYQDYGVLGSIAKAPKVGIAPIKTENSRDERELV
jgi:hypothetical protein